MIIKKCTICEKTTKIEVKPYLNEVKKDKKCGVCGGKVEYIVLKSDSKMPKLGYKELEFIKKYRLGLLKKKAIDLGLEAKIVKDELMVRGDSEKVKFFQFSMNVFSILQLLNYNVPASYFYALGLIKEQDKNINQEGLRSLFSKEEVMQLVDIRVEGGKENE